MVPLSIPPETPVGVGPGIGGPFEIGGNARVTYEMHAAPAEPGDALGRFGSIGERESDDVRTRFGQSGRNRLSDTARGSGDDGAAAGEIEG